MLNHLRCLASVVGAIWASPCSLVGGALALSILLAGGSVRRVGQAIEVFLHDGASPDGSRCSRLPFSAITLGQVIVAVSSAELERLREHELVHVRQYLWLGPLFCVAYPLASLLAVLRGKCAYAGNAFEVQAVELSRGSRNAA